MRMCGRASVLLLVLALLLPAAPSRAGAPAEPLPPHLLAHVSVKSPAGLLTAVDALAHSVTAGSRYAVMPGMITMLAMFSLPAPFESWGSDEPAHVLFIPWAYDQFEAVGVFAVDDFDAFLGALRADHDDIDEESLKSGYPRAVSIADAVVVDLGDGRAAVGKDAETIRKALGADGWKPVHESDADIVLRMAVPKGEESFHEAVTGRLLNNLSMATRRFQELGMKPEVARAITNLTAQYLPRLAAEMDLVREGYAEIRLAGETVLVDAGVRSAAEALMTEVANRLAGGSPVASPFAANIPAGALSVATFAPADAFLADAPARLTALADEISSEAFPAIRDRMLAANRAFFAAGPGPSVSSVFIRDGRRLDVSLMPFEEAGQGYRAHVDGLGMFGEVVGELVEGTDFSFSLLVEELSADGAAYTRVRPEFADPDLVREIMARLAARTGENAPLDLDLLSSLRLFLMPLDGMVAMVIGPLDDAEFLQLVREVAARAESPLIESAPAQAVRSLLGPSQAAAGVIDGDGFFHAMAVNAGQQLTAHLGESGRAAYGRALDRMIGRYQGSGEVMAYSVGAEGDWLVARLAIPATVANAMVRSYESLSTVFQEELTGQRRSGPGGGRRS